MGCTLSFLAFQVSEGHVVTLAAQHLQVLGPVVSAVAANMVHNFARLKRPPERFLGQPAVHSLRLPLRAVPHA